MSDDICDRVAFIGGGNMATSLVRGLLGSGHPATGIVVSDPLAEQRARIAELGVDTTADNDVAVHGADAVVLAVKPQVMARVLAELGSLEREQLVISIAAGVTIAALARGTHPRQPIIRCMPNTPALVGAGITALHASSTVSEPHRRAAETILGAVGKTVWVEHEALLDAVTAVSGSGPAYFFYLMEAMIEAGQGLGLSREIATLLTLETAYGAALLAREDGAPEPAELRANVTSPGGTTQRALSILDAGDTRGIISAALAGAAERSRELAEESGPT